MKVHLGINNCYAVKRWPEPDVWGKQISERLGLRYVQFTFDLLDPRCTEEVRYSMCGEIKRAAKKFGFEVHNAVTGLAAFTYNMFLHPFIEFRKDGLRWCEQAAVTSEWMGARGVGGGLSGASTESFKDPVRREYLVNEFIESLKYFARYAAVHNQKFIIWEPSPLGRDMLCSIDEGFRLHERLNRDVPIPIQFNINLGHQCGYEMKGRDRDTYKWLEELGRFSPVINIQQTDGLFDRHWPFTKEYNEKGIIKMDKVLKALDKSGLKEVYFFPEIIHPFELEESEVLKDLDESFKYLKQFI